MVKIYNHGKKIVDTPDAICYNYILMVTTEIENGARHCSVANRGSRFIIILPLPHQSMLGGI